MAEQMLNPNNKSDYVPLEKKKRLSRNDKKHLMLEMYSNFYKMSEIRKALKIKSSSAYYNLVKEVFKDNIKDETKYESIISMLNQRHTLIDITYNQLVKLLKEEREKELEGKYITKEEKSRVLDTIKTLSSLMTDMERFKSKIGLLPNEALELGVKQTNLFKDIEKSVNDAVKRYRKETKQKQE